MAWLFASGHAIDLVLAVMIAEGCWLVARRGVPAREVAGMMVPGALILLAARAALAGGTGADWRLIALPLALSFPAHMLEVVRRGWLRSDRPESNPVLIESLGRATRERAGRAPLDQDCVLR